MLSGRTDSAHSMRPDLIQTDMKRLLLIICILIPVAAMASTPGKRVSKSRITSFISECRHYDGVEVVRLGRIATGALRGVMRVAAMGDPDVRDALRLMKGVNGVAVFDFEDCSEYDKSRITSRLNRILSGSEVLMEASDGGDKMRIYGVVDESADSVKDFVLYTPSDCALICIFGSISMDAVAKIASND